MKNVEQLKGRLVSVAYPCPYGCCDGTITIEIDHEYDDGGAPISSWPVFYGDCEDPEDEVAQNRLDAMVDGYTYYPQHAERLNAEVAEADYDDPDVVRLLGMYAERRALAQLAGLAD